MDVPKIVIVWLRHSGSELRKVILKLVICVCDW